MSLAVATSVPVSAWLAETPETILTALQLLDERAAELEAARGQ